MRLLSTGGSLTRASYGYDIVLHEGTHGTLLGRANRATGPREKDELGWPIGPWHKEPDVMISRYEGLHTFIIRQDEGCLAAYLVRGSDAPDTGETWPAPNIGHVRNWSHLRDDIHVSMSTMDYAAIGAEGYAQEYGLATDAMIKLSHASKGGPTVEADYIPMSAWVSIAGKVVKALRAQRLFADTVNRRYFELGGGNMRSCEHLVAQAATANRNCKVFKTWSNSLLVHTYDRLLETSLVHEMKVDPKHAGTAVAKHVLQQLPNFDDVQVAMLHNEVTRYFADQITWSDDDLDVLKQQAGNALAELEEVFR